jgi:hypothetical protein
LGFFKGTQVFSSARATSAALRNMHTPRNRLTMDLGGDVKNMIDLLEQNALVRVSESCQS